MRNTLIIIPFLTLTLLTKRDTIVCGDTLQIQSTIYRGKIKYYNCFNPIRKTTTRILAKKP